MLEIKEISGKMTSFILWTPWASLEVIYAISCTEKFPDASLNLDLA